MTTTAHTPTAIPSLETDGTGHLDSASNGESGPAVCGRFIGRYPAAISTPKSGSVGTDSVRAA